MAKNKKSLGNPVIKKVAKAVASKKADLGSSNGVTVIESNKGIGLTNVILLSGLGLGGYFLGKNILDQLKENQTSNNYTNDEREEKITDPKTGNEKIVKWSPTQIASEFNSAMGGNWDGTATQTVMNLADKSKGSRWEPIAKAYRKQAGSNLVDRLTKELSALEFSAFNSIINNTSSHKFGNKEILSVKKLSGIKVINAITNKWENQTFYWNGSNLGVVTARKIGASSGNKYYVLSKYPDYWFREEDLMRDYDSLATIIWAKTGI